MGRGLGRLEREILDSLEIAKERQHSYRGYDGDDWHPGWLVVNRAVVRIPPDIHDLRATARFLAVKNGAIHAGSVISPAFDASFSRAVRSLLARGYLARVSMLPVIECEKDDRGIVESFSDGNVIVLRGRQTRFVRKAKGYDA